METTRGASALKAIFDNAEPIEIELVVNAETRRIRASPLRRLLDVLRDDLRLTGTKEGCGEGECGACTVLVDGEACLACLTPLGQVEERAVTTIEGAGFEALQAAFLAEGGAQCGICTPGMICMARAWIDECARERVPATLAGARTALAGNLCRCTGYEKILVAVLRAAAEREA
jgi:carbon-monoxide dehydrogenase small subunit